MDTLETERLVLERWDERHREPWRSICRDPAVMRFIGGGEIWERERADEAFDRALAHWLEHGFGRRAVIDKRSGDWLGFTSLNRVVPQAVEVPPGEHEIGWWIARQVWGSGYATEAAAATRYEHSSGSGSTGSSPARNR